MSLSPPVTIVLPAYNAADFIGAAVRSVRQQTFTDWTLMVIDDGSDDDTVKIAKAECEYDSRCIVMAREHRGITSVLRDAVAGISSPWIARLDADDAMTPTRLERQLRTAINGHYAVLGSATLERCKKNPGQRIVNYPTTDRECRDMLSGIWARSPFAHPSVLMDRKAVVAAGNYNPRWNLSQDLALFLEMARRPGFMGNLEQPLTVRTIHPKQRSNRAWRRRWDTYRINLNATIRRLA
jgi:glycosyltransferase involved in cell wall biosynthesis